MAKRSKKNWTAIEARIRLVMREICDEVRDEVVTASQIVDRAMKRLELPTSNPTAVYLMREGLRYFENREMRRAIDGMHSALDEKLKELCAECSRLSVRGSCKPRDVLPQTQFFNFIKRLQMPTL